MKVNYSTGLEGANSNEELRNKVFRLDSALSKYLPVCSSKYFEEQDNVPIHTPVRRILVKLWILQLLIFVLWEFVFGYFYLYNQPELPSFSTTYELYKLSVFFLFSYVLFVVCPTRALRFNNPCNILLFVLYSFGYVLYMVASSLFAFWTFSWEGPLVMLYIGAYAGLAGFIGFIAIWPFWFRQNAENNHWLCFDIKTMLESSECCEIVKRLDLNLDKYLPKFSKCLPKTADCATLPTQEDEKYPYIPLLIKSLRKIWILQVLVIYTGGAKIILSDLVELGSRIIFGQHFEYYFNSNVMNWAMIAGACFCLFPVVSYYFYICSADKALRQSNLLHYLIFGVYSLAWTVVPVIFILAWYPVTGLLVGFSLLL